MKSQNNNTLQKRPKALDAVRVDLPPHIFARTYGLRLRAHNQARPEIRSHGAHPWQPDRHCRCTALRTKLFKVAASVFSITWQTTLPLRLIAPITVVLPLIPERAAACSNGGFYPCHLSQFRQLQPDQLAAIHHPA